MFRSDAYQSPYGLIKLNSYDKESNKLKTSNNLLCLEKVEKSKMQPKAISHVALNLASLKNHSERKSHRPNTHSAFIPEEGYHKVKDSLEFK